MREMAADVEYTIGEVVLSGADFNGHECPASEGHTYLAVLGFNGVHYYGWVEMDGMTVVSSAITADGPLVIGTGIFAIPEPAGGLLVLLGVAALALRRRVPPAAKSVGPSKSVC